ncbi:MAG: gamma-glutamyl-gamma-aminobutyrate hydrolase family protein [Verrucomicrobiota bacterium]
MCAPPTILVVPGTMAEGPEFLDHSITLSDAYLTAVVKAGALPMVMPCTSSADLIAAYVARADGVLLTGGDDIQPGLYGARVTPAIAKTLSSHDPIRDLAELEIVRQIFGQGKPLLAICRGMQLLNVAFGGTLYMDLPSEAPGSIAHSQLELKDRAVHPIDISGDSLLSEIFERRELGVNSTHHQAVRDVAPPLRVTARSPDGIAEAMELGLADRHRLPYLLAVQFHPERLIPRHSEFIRLFRSFVRACGKKE